MHTPLIVDGHIYSESTDKANIFKNYFTEHSSLNDRYASLPTDLHLPDYILHSITITPYAVESILSSLQLGKAAGPDIINNRILKELKDVLSTPLCDLFNGSHSQGKVPNILKEANVTAIHKKSDPADAAS